MKYNPLWAAFSQLLISGTLVHEGSFEELQETFGTNVRPHLVLVVSMDRYPELAIGKPDAWRTEVGHALIEAIEEVMTDPYIWIWTEEGVLALLVDSGRWNDASACEPGATLLSQMKMTGRRIQASAAQRGISVSIGIGGTCENPEELHRSFQEAVQAMSGRFFQGNGLIFVYGEDLHGDEVWGELLTAEKAELLALVRIGDQSGVVMQLRSLLEALAKECGYREAMFRSEVVDIVMMVTRGVVESGVGASLIFSQNAQFIRELYSTIRYDRFVQKVCDYARWLTEQVGQVQLQRLSPAILKAVHFMQQNHKEELSLDDVSRHCAMSKYHLSHLFKKETELGVIEFLNRIRMEKAVVYLQTTDLPIQQIASQVGFEDANYFSRIFKRHKKISPRDFRSATLC